MSLFIPSVYSATNSTKSNSYPINVENLISEFSVLVNNVFKDPGFKNYKLNNITRKLLSNIKTTRDKEKVIQKLHDLLKEVKVYAENEGYDGKVNFLNNYALETIAKLATESSEDFFFKKYAYLCTVASAWGMDRYILLMAKNRKIKTMKFLLLAKKCRNGSDYTFIFKSNVFSSYSRLELFNILFSDVDEDRILVPLGLAERLGEHEIYEIYFSLLKRKKKNNVISNAAYRNARSLLVLRYPEARTSYEKLIYKTSQLIKDGKLSSRSNKVLYNLLTKINYIPDSKDADLDTESNASQNRSIIRIRLDILRYIVQSNTHDKYDILIKILEDIVNIKKSFSDRLLQKQKRILYPLIDEIKMIRHSLINNRKEIDQIKYIASVFKLGVVGISRYKNSSNNQLIDQPITDLFFIDDKIIVENNSPELYKLLLDFVKQSDIKTVASFKLLAYSQPVQLANTLKFYKASYDDKIINEKRYKGMLHSMGKIFDPASAYLNDFEEYNSIIDY